MKKMILALLLFALPAFAASPGLLEKDLNGYVVQGGAPNASLTQSLTAYSTTVAMGGSLWWSLYVPSDCKFRILPTSANGSYPQDTAIGGSRTSFLVNKASTFVNFSGCTSGVLQRQ